MARCYPLSRAAPQSTPQEPTPAVASPKVSVFGANVAYCQTSHPRKGYSMLPLPIEFEDRLFRYAQVEREDDVAIFTQTHKASGHVRFEVVRIRVQAEHTWPTGVTTPEKEAYPGSTAWGRWGHTCFTLAEAQALAATWQQQRDTPVPPDEPEEEEPGAEASGDEGH